KTPKREASASGRSSKKQSDADTERPDFDCEMSESPSRSAESGGGSRLKQARRGIQMQPQWMWLGVRSAGDEGSGNMDCCKGGCRGSLKNRLKRLYDMGFRVTTLRRCGQPPTRGESPTRPGHPPETLLGTRPGGRTPYPRRTRRCPSTFHQRSVREPGSGSGSGREP